MLRYDPGAQGLVFFGANGPSPFLCLRYISKEEDSGHRFLRLKADYLNIEDASTLRPMRRVNAGCVEARVRTNVPPAEAMRDREGAWSAEATFHSIDTQYLLYLGLAWPNMPMTSR